ncbi:MAG: peptide deformylase [Bacteroidales bacterium]|nr:peptide deformylase [Bacteroidales bacterium]
MVLPIYLYGQPVLRETAQVVDLNEKAEIDKLVQDLWDTLAVADGCGLAAPQVGISKRMVIVDGTGLTDTYDYLEGFKKTLINPVITQESEECSIYSEGCLSVPGIYADVRRPKKITVEYYDEKLQKHVEEFDNFAARIVQHELEHLDGGLFVDDVAPIRKKLISKKLAGIAARKIQTRYKSR